MSEVARTKPESDWVVRSPLLGGVNLDPGMLTSSEAETRLSSLSLGRARSSPPLSIPFKDRAVSAVGNWPVMG